MKGFLKLPNCILERDTFRRIFEKINKSERSMCFKECVKVERDKRSVVAIDKKTIYSNVSNEHRAYHVI